MGPQLDADRAQVETIANHMGAALLEFEHAPIPMFLLLPDGHIVDVNAALRSLIGYDLAELVGSPVSAFLGAASQTLALARMEAALASSGPLPEQAMSLCSKDGRDIAVTSAAVTVRDDDGAPLYILGRVRPASTAA